jgi:hypothetical protein
MRSWPNQSIALDPETYMGTAAEALAVIVAEETEAERVAQGGAPRGLRPLSSIGDVGISFESHVADGTHWFEYLAKPRVLDRCAKRAGIDKPSVLTRCIDELRPGNWETLFWLREFLVLAREEAQGNARKEAADRQFSELQLEFAHRTERAREGAAKTNRSMSVAKQWLLEKFEKFGHQFESKAKFAEHYRIEVKRELGTDVTEGTITDRWLKGKSVPHR